VLMNKLLTVFTDPKNNLFQSDVWKDYEEALGNKTFHVSCDEGSALLVKMPLYKDKSFLYCPRGPMCTKEGWHVFLRKAREIAAKEDCIFVRVEPYSLPNGIVKDLKFRKVGQYSPLSHQYSPMDTQILDLAKRDDVLLEEMKPKWRYNIKLAYRKGVTVRTSTNLSDLKKFHEMSMNMKERGYTPFGLTHYERLLYTLSQGKHVKLFIAEYQKQPLSMLLVTQYGEVATYLHGASSDEFRDLMPNHVAQWEAIMDSQRNGCLVYDFWGVAPEGAENHGWAGITRFKTGFGGEAIHFVGAFDFAFSPLWYNILYIYNLVRKIVKNEI